MGLALTAIVFALLFIALNWLWKHMKLRYALSGINQPRSLPVIGHGLIIKPDIEGFIDQVMGMALLYPNSPRMVLFWTTFKPLLMVYEASIAEKVFNGTAHLHKGHLYDMLRPWLGDGLLTSYSKPEQWKPRRKLLTPTFHYDILKNFIHVFNHQTEILINELKKNFDDKSVKIVEIEDIGKLVSLCALDIICETSMGQSVRAQLESESDYVRAVLRINDIIQNRQKNPFVHSDLMFNLFGEGKEQKWAVDILHSFTKKVIDERRKTLSEDIAYSLKEKPAFLDLLLELENQGLIDGKSIQEEVDTFMFEGHDTTATAVTWALHVFGCYPEIQQKVYEEICQVCGDSSEITSDHLSKLTYLECCIKEILRLYPSVPMIVRRLGAPITIGEHTIPAGVEVLINIFLIHRDPNFWEDAELFKPERFSQNDSTKRHAFAYVPFSAGSRNCIGQRFALMEEKVMLALLLRSFEVESMRRRDEQFCRTELILRPKDGMPVRLKLRNGH